MSVRECRIYIRDMIPEMTPQQQLTHWNQLWPIAESDWAVPQFDAQKRRNTVLTGSPAVRVDAKRWRHRLCWDYLRISPSYWQVHQAQTSQRTSRAIDQGSTDLSDVRHTYALMGDVYGSSFQKWYDNCEGFKKRDAVPLRVEQIAYWPSIRNATVADFQDLATTAQHWHATTFANAVDTGAQVFIVPHSRRQSLTIPALQRLLSNHWPYNVPQRRTAFVIERQTRHQVFSVWQNLALVRWCALHPDQELWRAGALWHQRGWGIDTAASLDPLSQRAARGETDVRNTVTTHVSRRLSHAFWLAENAASGHFPCHRPIWGLSADWQFADGVLAQRLNQLHGDIVV